MVSVSRWAHVFDPIATAAGRIGAVADLGDHALEPDLAGVGEPLGAVDLEAFAELDVGTGDDLFQLRLARMSLTQSRLRPVGYSSMMRLPLPENAAGLDTVTMMRGAFSLIAASEARRMSATR